MKIAMMLPGCHAVAEVVVAAAATEVVVVWRRVTVAAAAHKYAAAAGTPGLVPVPVLAAATVAVMVVEDVTGLGVTATASVAVLRADSPVDRAEAGAALVFDETPEFEEVVVCALTVAVTSAGSAVVEFKLLDDDPPEVDATAVVVAELREAAEPVDAVPDRLDPAEDDPAAARRL